MSASAMVRKRAKKCSFSRRNAGSLGVTGFFTTFFTTLVVVVVFLAADCAPFPLGGGASGFSTMAEEGGGGAADDDAAEDDVGLLNASASSPFFPFSGAFTLVAVGRVSM